MIMNVPARKRELILKHELAFANAIGAAVFEKPRVSFWMVMIPLLLLYFIYRMQKYKNGRRKFDEDFMTTRRRTMEIAFQAVATGGGPDIDQVVRQSGLSGALEKPYASWVKVLADYYMDLLTANGDTFESLVRSAYRNRSTCLLVLNRLDAVEKDFYDALKPQLVPTEGAAEIIHTIEKHSRQLRRDLAEHIFA